MRLLDAEGDAFWKHEASEGLDEFINDPSIAGS